MCGASNKNNNTLFFDCHYNNVYPYCWNLLILLLLSNETMGNPNVEYSVTGLITLYNYTIILVFKDNDELPYHYFHSFLQVVQAGYLRLNGLTTRVLRP